MGHKVNLEEGRNECRGEGMKEGINE